MPEISLVIITYNEAKHIRRCIESAQVLADEVLVVDSLSTDDTVAIAESLGARVLLQPFLGYVEQKRFAIAQATHRMVLSLDADEALSDSLRQSIQQEKTTGLPKDCYFMHRLSNIDDQWIKHGGWYPDRKMRLFAKELFAVEGINPHDKFVPLPGARTGFLKGDILHYTNSDIESRIKTINHFSTLAAQAFHERGKKGSWFRMLTKPAFRFFIEYVLRRGFFDGFYGYVVARTSAEYVFMRESKLIALQRRLKYTRLQ